MHGAKNLAEFESFSILHLAAIVGIVVATVALTIARRRTGIAAGRRIDGWLCAGLVATALFCHGSRAVLEPFEGANSLPLHLCHLSSVIAPIAIATSWWPARVLLYFWGLIFGSQALITPVLEEGPAKLEFWRFWIGHGAIAAAAVYDLAARGFRPGLRAAWFAIAASAAYVAAVMPVNLLGNANFGYVGPSLPQRPSILDLLGPWPQRLVWIMLIGCAVALLAALPWEWAIRRTPARSRRPLSTV